MFDFNKDTLTKQYTENVEAIMQYIGTNYKHWTADLVRSLELPLDIPAPIFNPAEVALAIEIE